MTHGDAGDATAIASPLFVLGAGRAGRGLARAFRNAGITMAGLHGRRAEALDDGSLVTAGALPATLRDARVILVAVQDAALDAALVQLGAVTLHDEAVVLHASGASDPVALAALRARGIAGGTFHPLAPLADDGTAAAMLRGGWIGIDGDARAIAAARVLAAGLGAQTIEIPAGEKARYHAAAVIASNFPVVLAAFAEQLLRDAGMAERGPTVVRSLLAGTVRNLDGRSAMQALTGPAARGDDATIARHRAAIAADTTLLAAYDALTSAARRLGAERAAGTEQE